VALTITESEWQKLRRHAEETYPQECCGVLLGRIGADEIKAVHAAIPCRNARTDSAHNRYCIGPDELIRIQREARERELAVIGFYHSHPDGHARWSHTDLADAHWSGCSYVITNVENGHAVDTNAFVLIGEERNKRFDDEAITRQA